MPSEIIFGNQKTLMDNIQKWMTEKGIHLDDIRAILITKIPKGLQPEGPDTHMATVVFN